jgi:mersacidin/lichenicidin family type 2 lantibiotic
MYTSDVINAWRDPESRRGMTDEQRESLPEHPAGLVELNDDELDGLSGGLLNPTIRWGHYWPGCG